MIQWARFAMLTDLGEDRSPKGMALLLDEMGPSQSPRMGNTRSERAIAG